MKIELSSFQGEFLSKNDLEGIIPSKRKGKALNYGEGEGQLEVDGTVWGVYFGENENYFIQFEEGHLLPSQFISLVQDLTTHIKNKLGAEVSIRGTLEAEGSIQSEVSTPFARPSLTP